MKFLGLHVHTDVVEAAKFHCIPLAHYKASDVYILQGNRIVFIGKSEVATRWIKQNEGKYCKSVYRNLFAY